MRAMGQANARISPQTTRTCSFWLEDVVHARFHDGAEVSLRDAMDNVAATADLVGGKKTAVMVDLRPIRSQSAEARAYFAGEEAAKVCYAVALIIGSPMTRVIGNFYLRVNRPKVPTRLFTSEAEAQRWLASVPRDGDGAAH